MLLNPVLTKIDVNISDFVIAVGVVLDVSVKSEVYVTSIQKVIVASFVLNQSNGDSASSAGSSSLIPVKKKDEDTDTDVPMEL